MKIYSLVAKAYLAIAVTIFLPGIAAAQTTEVRKSDLVRLLGEVHLYAPIRQDLHDLGFRGEKLDLAEAQFKRMLDDPLIAGNIADRILAAQGQPIGSAAEAGGLFWPLVDRGLGHLSAREMRYFYLVEQTMLKALSQRDCGLAIKERLSPQRLATATGRVAARLNTPALREYYRIQYKAARLGATRSVRKLSARDEARIVEKINAALAERVAEEKDTQALLSAYENLQNVSNRRACAAGRVFMDAVLGMEGRDLHHALILLSAP